jgi:hypothetical protein
MYKNTKYDRAIVAFAIEEENQWPPKNLTELCTKSQDVLLGLINFVGETIGRILIFAALGSIFVEQPFFGWRVTKQPYTITYDLILIVKLFFI